MSFLGIKIPNHLTKTLSQLKIPGEKEDSAEYHLTLLHFPNLSIDSTQKILKETYSILETMEPFEILSEEISSFPIGQDGVPIILKVKSPELINLQKDLSNAFDKCGINFSKRFEYNPHITLAFSDKEIEPIVIEPISFLTTEITLWYGNKGFNDFEINFFLKI